jgi:hypothetical protein
MYPKCPAMAGSDSSDTISPPRREKFSLTITDTSEALMSITNYPQPYRFTKENARENAAKSWQVRRERKAKLEAEAQQGRQSTPQSERLALQIERVEQMMERTKDPDALQKLSATHARLFNAWQVLTATPNPGSLRHRGRGRPVFVLAEPVEPSQEPV